MQQITERMKVMMALEGYPFSYGPFYCPNCWREYAFFSKIGDSVNPDSYVKHTGEVLFCNECCYNYKSRYTAQLTLAEFP